jgi:hypothetical protein
MNVLPASLATAALIPKASAAGRFRPAEADPPVFFVQLQRPTGYPQSGFTPSLVTTNESFIHYFYRLPTIFL